MGWWEQSAEGESFAETGLPLEQQLLWGDGPADSIDNALTQIKADFLRDIGRMPSQAEIIAGIKFSTRVLDDLAETPEKAPHATEDQLATVHEHGYRAYWSGFMNQGGAEQDEIARSRHEMGAVLNDLSVAPPVPVSLLKDETETLLALMNQDEPASTVPEDYSFHEENTVIRGRDT